MPFHVALAPYGLFEGIEHELEGYMSTHFTIYIQHLLSHNVGPVHTGSKESTEFINSR